MRVVSQVTGRRVGGSTGTNVWGALQLVGEMVADGIRGSVVTLICDGGERYAQTYYSRSWLDSCGLDVDAAESAVRGFLATGRWDH
jgi:cysteine synthase A